MPSQRRQHSATYIIFLLFRLQCFDLSRLFFSLRFTKLGIILCLLSGSLHVSAYEEDEGSLLVSHLGISTSEAGWKKCPFCPTRGKVRGKHLMFSGTTGVSFMAEMQHGGGIQLDVPVTVELSAKDTYPAVFQFTPTKDISSTQLDITVTSESDDVPAYLKVSRDCKDVKENIDDVDYKGESLRLSFAKKGRITLSKFSIPPLTASTSSWFIGIAIKNASGDTPIDARKRVTLTLKRSFHYTYRASDCILFLGCGVCGVVMSVIAWVIFRECFPCCHNQEKKTNLTCSEFFSAMGAVLCRHTWVGGPKTYSYITLIVGWALMVGSFQFIFADWYLMIQEGDRDHCYYNDFCYRVRYADIPYNLMLSNLAFVLHGLILAINVLCMESEVFARCQKIASKPSNKTSNTSNTGENENMPQTAHALSCPDISLHLGDLLVPQDKNLKILSAEAKKKKFCFSIPYAFAWALCFEGMYSALYHLCPSKLAFQFDTAFMFVMASLSVMLMYNGIETTPCTEAVHAKRRVGAAAFFLFFLVPLFFLNYFGTMYHSEAGLTKKKTLFFLCLLLWTLIIGVWVLYKLCPRKCAEYCGKCLNNDIIKLITSNEKVYQTWRQQSNTNKDSDNKDSGNKDSDNKDSDNKDSDNKDSDNKGSDNNDNDNDNKDSDNKASNNEASNNKDRDKKFNCVVVVFYVLGFLLAIVLIGLALGGKLEFADAFLYLCVGESALVAFGSFLTSYLLRNSSEDWWTWFFGLKVLFSIVIVVILSIALYFFLAKATTNKRQSPEKSRDLNEECVSYDFFDDHDIWHILSSCGLFMGALMMIHVSYKLPDDSSGTSS